MTNAVATIELAHLPSMIDRAAQALLAAKSSAEVLEARDMASFVYDAAKRVARLTRAKDAHDSLIAAAHRAQADALDIEAQAKRRLADEYDAAQERGEVGRSGARTDLVPNGNEVVPSASAAGLTRKSIHEARIIRDAEAVEPGIVRRTLDGKLSRGEEPTRSALREAVTAAARPPQEDQAQGDLEQPEADGAHEPDADPARKKLAKLTREGLEDEVIGLRADNADLRKKVSTIEVERDDLKEKLRLATADDLGRSVGLLQRRCDQMRFARDEALKAAKREEYKRKQAEKRVSELQEMGIPLN